MKRSDLLCENAFIGDQGVKSAIREEELFGVRYSCIEVTEELERSYAVKKGIYYTLFTENKTEENIKRCLSRLLLGMLTEGGVLVAGLGNENVCSDSLGVKTVSNIPATAHLSEHEDFTALGLRPVYVLEAGVTGKTGIESSERIACIARHVKVSCVIAIDSLACSETERLCTTIQLTDTGISPGSGVSNDRRAVNKENCGTKVIAIGVPTVIDLESLCPDGSDAPGLMVTPRNIDSITDRMSRIIGASVSMALNPALTEAELRALVIK